MHKALDGSLSPRKRNGSQHIKNNRSVSDAVAFDGRKQWLSRKDIDAEYGWSYKTTERLEQDGKLIASVIRGKIKRYFRPHIEALLRDSFASLRALKDEQEVI